MCKITMFIYEYDKEKKCMVRKYETITTGISWQEAKEFRKTNRQYQIVVVR